MGGIYVRIKTCSLVMMVLQSSFIHADVEGPWSHRGAPGYRTSLSRDDSLLTNSSCKPSSKTNWFQLVVHTSSRWWQQLFSSTVRKIKFRTSGVSSRVQRWRQRSDETVAFARFTTEKVHDSDGINIQNKVTRLHLRHLSSSLKGFNFQNLLPFPPWFLFFLHVNLKLYKKLQFEFFPHKFATWEN